MKRFLSLKWELEKRYNIIWQVNQQDYEVDYMCGVMEREVLLRWLVKPSNEEDGQEYKF